MPSTYHQLHYHLVFTTKLRQPFLNPPLDTQLYAYTAGTLKNLDAQPLAINGTADHIHLLIRLSPSHAPANLVRELKKATSNFIKPKIPQFAWQAGYGIFTVSESDVPKITNYIRTQKEHHKTQSVEDELAFFVATEPKTS